jgi:hypothetical protein
MPDTSLLGGKQQYYSIIPIELCNSAIGFATNSERSRNAAFTSHASSLAVLSSTWANVSCTMIDKPDIGTFVCGYKS